jgi:hypothetical protein
MEMSPSVGLTRILSSVWLGHLGHPPHLFLYLSSHTYSRMVSRSLTLSHPFISRCYTLLKYYLPASLKRLLLLLLHADVTQLHTHIGTG